MSALEVYDVDTFDSTSTPSLIEMIAAVEPLHKRLSPRARRRDEKRRRNRGVRPSDAVEMKTSGWFKRKKKDPQLHPRYGCTRLALVPDEAGDRVPDVQWHFPKPAPNRRRELVPIEDSTSELIGESAIAAAATTEIAASDELMESDVILEAPRRVEETLAVVLVPTDDGVTTVLGLENDDEPDGELMSLLCGESLGPQYIELPTGFHVEDGGGALSRRTERERLARAAQIEPDWGDPEQWDFGRNEPTHLPTYS